MGNVRRKDDKSFNKGNHQRKNNDYRNLTKKFSYTTFEKQEGGKSQNRGNDRCHNGRYHFQGAVNGRLHTGFAAFVMLIDIFGDHNTVVHQNTNNDDHSEE